MDVTWGVTLKSFHTRGTHMENLNKKQYPDGDRMMTDKRCGHGHEQDVGGNESEPLNPFARASRVRRTPPRPRVDSCPDLTRASSKSRMAEDRDKRKRVDATTPPSESRETSLEDEKDPKIGGGNEVFVVEGSPSPDQTRELKKRREQGPPSSSSSRKDSEESANFDEAAISSSLRHVMHKLVKMAGDLLNETKRNTNTKVEIKKMAREIDAASHNLSKRLNSYCTAVGKMLREHGDRVDDDSPEKANTTEVACQTDPLVRKLRRREDDQKTVTEAETVEGMTKASRANWREEWYTATVVRVGNPWNSPGEEDFAILLPESEEKMEAGVGKLLKDRFPEVVKIVGTGSLKVTSTVQLGTEEPATRSRLIFKVGLTGVTEAEILSALESLKRLALQGGGTVVIPTPTGVDESVFRKLVELVFRKDRVRALIYVPQRKGKTRSPPTQRLPMGDSKRERRERETDVLLIKQGGKSYSDLVRGLRQTVGVNQEGKGIKQIRKTQDGRLLVAFQKGDPAMETMKKEIQGKWEGAQVSGGRRGPSKSTVHIKGLDDGAEDGEIREALCELAAGLKKEDIEIGPRRPMHGGNWAVTVSVAGPESLVKGRKKIRIGFNTCTVEERIDVRKCYRCWEFGHLARNCRGPDRSSRCSGCGQEGHLAASCQKGPYCLLCDEAGHSAGSATCPKFKEALMGKRELARGSVEPALHGG